MKKSIFFILFIVLLIFILYSGCKKDDTHISTVSIKVPAGDYDSLTYHLSNDSFTAYSLWNYEHGYFDSTGHVFLEIETNRIGWFFLTLHPNRYDHELKMKSRIFILLRPGDSYSIEYDSSHPQLFKINGDYNEAQNLYNHFYHSDIASNPRTNWYPNYDSLPRDLLDHLEDSINNTLKPFQVLLKNKRIDDEYYHSIKAQVQYSHADALLDHIELRQKAYNEPRYLKIHKEVTPLNLSFKDIIYINENIFEKYSPNKEEARILPGYAEYIDKYLSYKAKLDFTYSFDQGSYSGKLEKVKKSSLFFDDAVVEYYFADQFNSGFMNQGPDSLATFLFRAYKDQYPESRFMPGIINSVEGLTGFYAAFYPGLNDSPNSIEETTFLNHGLLSPDIEIIQEKDSITTFGSLLSQFKGKNLYVDFWASWCPPCRYEFRFADSLHHFLESQDIEMLYISSDEDENKWYNTIQNYNLRGYHFRVSNPVLMKDLRKVVHFLPTYMIIDSTGRIIEYDAERPHTKSKLYNQLNESFKKRGN